MGIDIETTLEPVVNATLKKNTEQLFRLMLRDYGQHCIDWCKGFGYHNEANAKAGRTGERVMAFIQTEVENAFQEGRKYGKAEE